MSFAGNHKPEVVFDAGNLTHCFIGVPAASLEIEVWRGKMLDMDFVKQRSKRAAPVTDGGMGNPTMKFFHRVRLLFSKEFLPR